MDPKYALYEAVDPAINNSTPVRELATAITTCHYQEEKVALLQNYLQYSLEAIGRGQPATVQAIAGLETTGDSIIAMLVNYGCAELEGYKCHLEFNPFSGSLKLYVFKGNELPTPAPWKTQKD